jgi:Na+-transporting NADH:ubiquinone oxidoreductase subunit NqrD
MNTLSTKLTAFTAALVTNCLIMGAVGYLFALQAQPHLSAIAFAHKIVAHSWLV